MLTITSMDSRGHHHQQHRSATSVSSEQQYEQQIYSPPLSIYSQHSSPPPPTTSLSATESSASTTQQLSSETVNNTGTILMIRKHRTTTSTTATVATNDMNSAAASAMVEDGFYESKSADIAVDGLSSTSSTDSIQLNSTIAETRFIYSLRFSINNCAANAFAGEFGFGSSNNDCIDVKIADTSYVGLQRVCNISKHILPSV